MKHLFFILIITVLFTECSGTDNKNSIQHSSAQKSNLRQLNISILLDLSDRISPEIDPDSKGSDIENIRTITEYFKSNMANLGAYNSKGKIRVFFSPIPSNNNINTIVDKLNIDCSKMSNKDRKLVFDNITTEYSENLNKIYAKTISSSTWEGSDIWRFFKNDVKDFCISHDPMYRNILIILTDGYIYHKESVYNEKNRYTYLLGNSNLKPYRNQRWEQLVNKNDFGILTKTNKLNDLDVLVLGIKAENSNNKIDEDILQYLWKKWLNEMNVSHYEVYSYDLPANAKTRIENFLNSK